MSWDEHERPAPRANREDERRYEPSPPGHPVPSQLPRDATTQRPGLPHFPGNPPVPGHTPPPGPGPLAPGQPLPTPTPAGVGPGGFVPGPGVPGFPGAGGPGQGGQKPPRRTGLIIGITTGIAAVLVAVIVGAIALANTIKDAMPAADQIVRVEPLPTVNIVDRPEFLPLRDRLESRQQQYRDMLDDGRIFEIVPRSEAGIRYAGDFLMITTDIVSALKIMSASGGYSSTIPEELDARLSALGEKADDAERRFLAGEDLGVSIRITREDGSVYESGGEPPAPVDVDAAEQAAREAPESALDPFGPDASGSYAAAGQALAESFGLTLDYDYSSVYAHCMSAPGTPTDRVTASYCIATPDRIYVNPDFAEYPANLSTPAFLDTVRHEIAHHLIGKTCDTSAPAITGTANEGVTNSYAVLFLGADRDRIRDKNNHIPEYQMSDTTDAIARGIHDQQRCG